MEEMQKAFNKTIIKLQSNSRIAEEQVSNERAWMLIQTRYFVSVWDWDGCPKIIQSYVEYVFSLA